MSLQKEVLAPQPSADGEPPFRGWAALAAVIIGALAVITLLVRQALSGEITGMPPLIHSLPFVGVVLVAVGLSIFRREGHVWLLASAIAVAVVAVFLGWFLVIALVGVLIAGLLQLVG